MLLAWVQVMKTDCFLILGALFIRILEYNDEPPYFEFPSYNLTMFEEQPIGSFVISLLALDANNAIASYQLLSNPGNLFAISAVSGKKKKVITVTTEWI